MKLSLLSHWFVNNNKLCISLMYYYIEIEPSADDRKICYKLQVFDDNKVALNFIFETLEDAITFAEDIVDKDYSATLYDIKKTYDEQYGKNKTIIKKQI